MPGIIRGSIVKFGDNIDTDQIYPGRYLELTDHKEIGRHAMEGVNPYKPLKEPAIIVAGKNFGCGSSREHALIALVNAGVKAVVAESFARIFFRNAINLGLPAVICHDVFRQVQEGEVMEIDLIGGIIRNVDSGKEIKIQKISPYVAGILNEGGLIALLRSGRTDKIF
jgi:3-isopropylmalate/(R)-2-methylmalate dehydratase small subunit